MFKVYCSNKCSILVESFNEKVESGICSKIGCGGVVLFVSEYCELEAQIG